VWNCWHSATPTRTPTSTSSRECRRVVQLATGITSIARVGRVGEDPRADVRVGVGVVEFQLIARVLTLGCRAAVGETAAHVF